MGRETFQIARPGFIADADSIARNTGRLVDFARVPDSYKNADGNKVVPGSTILSLTGSGKVIPRAAAEAAITALTETAGTATATAAGHTYEVGDSVTISGATVTAYNGTHTVTAVTATTFSFALTGSPADDTTATAGVGAKCILLSDAIENSKSAPVNGQGVILGGVLYETLMVEFGDDDFETFKAELKEAGTGYVFEAYSDSRGS